jgi:hypothetical protein
MIGFLIFVLTIPSIQLTDYSHESIYTPVLQIQVILLDTISQKNDN